MTKQQKARAHLARAQELLGQGTLAFGGVSDWIRQVSDWWGNDSKHLSKRARGEQETEHDYNTKLRYKQDMTSLLNLPDDVITKMITDGMLDGAQLIMLLQVNKDNSTNLNRIIKNTLVTMSKQYDDRELLLLKMKDLNMVYLLVKHGDKKEHPTLVTHAIATNKKDLLKAVLKGGSDANQTLHECAFSTPLSYAVQMRLYEIAKILIDNGADVNKQVIDPHLVPPVYVTPRDIALSRHQLTGHPQFLELSNLLLERARNPRSGSRVPAQV